jgi:hypothetical protein
LKMGLISCSKMSVRNYHLTLRNISEERRSHVTICKGGLGLALHDWVKSDLVWHNPVGRFVREFNIMSYI